MRIPRTSKYVRLLAAERTWPSARGGQALQGFSRPVSLFAEYQHYRWSDANFNTPAALVQLHLPRTGRSLEGRLHRQPERPTTTADARDAADKVMW
jgi:hypothetical protein